MAVVHLDIALGQDGLTAVVTGQEGVLTVPAGLESTPGGSAALATLFGLLAEALSAAPSIARLMKRGSVVVRVALLPPLCDVRLVELPGLRDEEIERVLQRDASRHFLGGTRSPVVGGVRVNPELGLSAPVLAAAASRGLLESLRNAVEIRGWELESIVPAHAAWWSALESAAPLRKRPSGGDGLTRLAVAVAGDTSHIIVMHGDAISHVRRVPANDPDALLDVAGGIPGTALVLADGASRDAIVAALKAAGWVIAQGVSPRDAAATAAREAGGSLPEIVPDFLARKRMTRERGLTSKLVTAAVGVLLIAAGVHYWGTARAYGDVREQREAIRATVAPVLANRDSLDRLTIRMDALSALEAQSSGWTASPVELSVLLPPETYLVSLRAVGDTVVMEAAGGRAGEALESLRGSPLLRSVQLEGPIQREIEGGTTARERFTVSGILTTLARDAAAPAAGGASGIAGPP